MNRPDIYEELENLKKRIIELEKIIAQLQNMNHNLVLYK